MPNGDPDWYDKELPQLEAFFAPIAEEIHQFARKNRLVVDRYYHQVPNWRLQFRHPHGGEASIDIWRIDDDSFYLDRFWWVDDPVAKTRSAKVARSGPHSRAAGELTGLLQRSLDEVSSWRPGELSDVDDEQLRREALQIHLRMLRPSGDAE